MGKLCGRGRLLAGVCLIFTCCGFADLREIGVSTVPSGSNAVLADRNTPVIVKFDTAMKKIDTERAVQVTTGTGNAECDLVWQGNELRCVPVPEWVPGIRYTLSLSGAVYAEDGREMRIAKHIPFFAAFASGVPYLVSFSPENGAAVGVDVGVEAHFSQPMDRKSTEIAFSLDGVSDKIFDWKDDDKTLCVKSGKKLSPWTVYGWKIGAKALSKNGVPLEKETAGQFITDEDRTTPQVERVYPMLRSGNRWLDTGAPFESGLGLGQGIGVSFNKAMDPESVIKSVRFDPTLSGRVEQTGDASIVFIPDRAPETGTAYTLIVSADTKDAAGLRLGTDYTARFTPDIPFLAISSITAGSASIAIGDAEGDSQSRIVEAKPSADGKLQITVNFSLPFTTDAMIDASARLTFSAFFPGTLRPVALESANWVGSSLNLRWAGITSGSAGEDHYYKLSIPGGKSGIRNGNGAALKENVTLYVRIKE